MPTLNEAAVLDMDQLRNVSMDDPELMRELVAALIEDTTAHIPMIQDAVEQADATKCARTAHYVKGACANVGAMSMAALLKTIELCAKTGDFCGCRTSLANLSAELEKFSAQATGI
ncbi:MAG TPA: Hpt domain-containing protein [Bryobacteraceae bacterium]|nr:Hpt domain-containing protein [Bryobacteraceae bacterium]